MFKGWIKRRKEVWRYLVSERRERRKEDRDREIEPETERNTDRNRAERREGANQSCRV